MDRTQCCFDKKMPAKEVLTTHSSTSFNNPKSESITSYNVLNSELYNTNADLNVKWLLSVLTSAIKLSFTTSRHLAIDRNGLT